MTEGRVISVYRAVSPDGEVFFGKAVRPWHSWRVMWYMAAKLGRGLSFDLRKAMKRHPDRAQWEFSVVGERGTDKEAFALKEQMISAAIDGGVICMNVLRISPENAKNRADEDLARASARMKERWNTPEALARASARREAAEREAKARKEEARKRKWTPEARAKRSAAMREVWKREGVREKRRRLHSDPEAKARHKAACKAAWDDPEAKERRIALIRKGRLRPEAKARHLMGVRAAANRQKEAKK